MRKRHFIFCFLLIYLSSILVACNQPTARLQGVSPLMGAVTWIDAPLDGDLLQPQEAYPVVVHAYDPGGVVQLELSANGTVLTSIPASSIEPLAVFKVDWVPQVVGNVLLLARTQGKNGQWNSESSVMVSVGEISPTPPPALKLTTTVSPTATVFTLTPSPTATSTATATATAKAGMTFTARVSTDQISYGGCGVNNVTIQGLSSNPSSVRDMVLFTKVKNQVTGKSTEWDSGRGMKSAGSGWYQVTLVATTIPNFNAYETSWLLYQIVATGDGGAIVGRSQTFSDITMSRCADAPPPAAVPTTPAPPIFVRPTPPYVPPVIIMPPSG